MRVSDRASIASATDADLEVNRWLGPLFVAIIFGFTSIAEAGLIIAVGLGVGLAIAATALVPLSHALTGSLRPHVPPDQLAAILGGSALMALLALAIPTRRALRSRPAGAIAVGE